MLCMIVTQEMYYFSRYAEADRVVAVLSRVAAPAVPLWRFSTEDLTAEKNGKKIQNLKIHNSLSNFGRDPS